MVMPTARPFVALIAIVLAACPGETAIGSTDFSDTAIRFPCMRDSVTKLRMHEDAAPRLLGRCSGELKRALGSAGLPRDAESRRVLWATALANRFAPYGTSEGANWQDLKHSPSLHCGSYAIIAEALYRFAGGTRSVTYLAWSPQSPIGSHAQLEFGGYVSDPTIGALFRASADSIIAGKRVRRWVNGGEWRYPAHWYDFEDWVVGALQGALLAPEDLLERRRSYLLE